MRNHSLALFSAAVLLHLAFFAPAAPAQTASGPWSIADCLSYGIENHPAIFQSLGQLKSSEARIGVSRAGLGTKVTLQSAFQRQRTEYSRSLALASGGSAGSDPLVDSTSESVAARKVIDDSGRTKEVLQANKSSHTAAKFDLTWKKIQVATEIKAAFYRVQQAKAMLRVQEEALKGFQEHLQKVKGFVEVGSKPPFDITKAEVDVANAQVNLIKAESAVRNAYAGLVQAMGLEGDLTIGEPDTSLTPAKPDLDMETLYKTALERPDIQSALQNSNVSVHQLRQVQKGKKPTWSGTAQYDWNGSVTPFNRAWNLGLAVSVPVLDGRLTTFQIKEAEGAIQTAQGRVTQLRQAVRAEVETSVTAVVDAFKRLDATNTLVRQASESLALAEGRYDAGVGSPIEITDARSAYSSAEGSQITAYFDSLIALANLDKVLGRLPAEIKE